MWFTKYIKPIFSTHNSGVRKVHLSSYKKWQIKSEEEEKTAFISFTAVSESSIQRQVDKPKVDLFLVPL